MHTTQRKGKQNSTEILFDIKILLEALLLEEPQRLAPELTEIKDLLHELVAEKKTISSPPTDELLKIEKLLRKVVVSEKPDESEEVRILNYPRTAKKLLPKGKTVIELKKKQNKQVSLPDGSTEDIYSLVPIEFCRSVGIWVDNDVSITFTFRGAIIDSAAFFPVWTRIPNLKFNRIEINTAVPTNFYIEMSPAVDGVPIHVPT